MIVLTDKHSGPDRNVIPLHGCHKTLHQLHWLNGLVVSALGIRTWGPRFDFQVASLFYWVATLGKLFTHIVSPQFLSSKKLGYKREFPAP